MQSYFEKNLAVIAGIVLPVLLVIFLSVTMFFIRSATPAPQYNFIYLTGAYTEVKVINNKLVIERYTGPGHSPPPHLFIFNVQTQQSEEMNIDFSIPTKLEDKKEIFEIGPLLNYTIDQKIQAPDGYTFNYNRMSMDFMYKRDPSYRYRISKNGKNVMIDSDENYIQFIGWIIPRS